MNATVNTQYVSHTYYPGKEPAMNDGKLVQITKLYADIFAAPPWNEYKICSNKHYSGRESEEEDLCSRCQAPLSLAWPSDKIMESINRHFRKQGGILCTFEDQKQSVVGVGWGSPCTVEEQFSRVYKTDAMYKIGTEALKTAQVAEKFFYLCEVLVIHEARGQGIASKMVKAMADRAKEVDLTLVLHTHTDSPMAKIANKLELHRLLDAGEDSENSGRVLYSSKK